MKPLARLTVCLCVLVVAQPGIAHDSPDRQSDALRGMTSVLVKVTEKSKIPGMPPEGLIQDQMQNLLQSKCNLSINSTGAPTGAEVHVDLLMIPVPVPQSKTTTKVALVRTSVWRPVIPTLSDGTTPDTSKPPLMMTGWIMTTITDPSVDPLLTNTIANHVSALEASLRAAGQLQALPKGFSEAFFASRLPAIQTKLQTLINAKLLAIPGVTAATAITVDLPTLNNGVLTYRFHGTLHTVPPLPSVDIQIDQFNPSGKLDLAALDAIGALPSGKLCFNGPPSVPITNVCVTVADLFQ
jgi:hypothetical protein